MDRIGSTPQFVAEAYQKMERRLQTVRERLNRPLTLADKILLSHLDDPAGSELAPRRKLPATPSRPRRPSGRHRPDGHSPVHAVRPQPRRRPHHRPLRPPHPGPRRQPLRHRRRPPRKQRGLPVPTVRLRQIRHGLLEARRGHHPPGGAGKTTPSPAA